MTDNVISLAKKAGNGKLRTPKQALEDVLKDISNDELITSKAKKILILGIDDSNEEYKVFFYQAGMKMSECVALTEVAKKIFLKDMGY